MILCVNLNAAIDKTVVVDSFQLGAIHRPETVHAVAGGKGCNVARALQRFGATPQVTGWVGGTAGQFIEQGLQSEGIATDFIYTDFESRTCTSILDSSNQKMTEIYEQGEPVSPENVMGLLDRFREIVGGATAVAFSGSIPPGVPLNIYAHLIEIAHAANVPTFLDSSQAALLQGVAAKPFLIKPNETEVSILVNRELTSLADFATAAADIAVQYGTIVVLSMGAAGALVAHGQTVVHAKNPPVAVKSAVGSGDCMLAGLVYGFTQGLGLETAIKYGVAAGTANTLIIGAGQFSMDDFDQIFSNIVVDIVS